MFLSSFDDDSDKKYGSIVVGCFYMDTWQISNTFLKTGKTKYISHLVRVYIRKLDKELILCKLQK